MQLVINIPDEFIAHYNMDKFIDSLKRIENDISICQEHEDGISGNYENELLDMFIRAFSDSSFVDKGISTFNERDHYKKAFESVDDKYQNHMLNCLKIFYSDNCKIDSVKDYLLTMLKCGLINCIDLGHVFFVFIFTLYFSESELDELLADLKKQMNKKEWF